MDKTLTPLVTVLMAVFNGEKFLKEAIKSILSQSYYNFEFIIINDGSTDSSLAIIDEFKDPRIRIIQNSINKGLINSLNLGIDDSNGKYIIRMDADDISAPHRIETQVNYMELNPEIGICGTAYRVFGDGVHSKIRYSETNPFQNKANLLFFPVVAHPSVIIRKSILDNHGLRYREEYKYAEDYGLWVEAVQFTKIANIRNVLLDYRILPDSITRKADRDIENRFRILKQIYLKYFELIGVPITEDDLKTHFIISDNVRCSGKTLLTNKQIDAYFESLTRNLAKHPLFRYYNIAILKRQLRIALIRKRWLQLFKRTIQLFYYSIAR